MRSLSKLMDEAMRENCEVVQGFTGDGVMAVFGAPLAFEDAPLRACRAALAILQRMKTAGPDLEANPRRSPNPSIRTLRHPFSAPCRMQRSRCPARRQ